MATAFGLLVLLLATMGLYSVMMFAVSQRTREIGIRMALGAQAGAVLRMVVWRGLQLALVGATLGLAAAFGLTRIMKNLLFNVSPTDPATFALIVLLLVAVALIACYIPARRAAKVDPLYARPDTTSADCASIRRGMPVMCNRQGPDFCHVTYVKCNEVAEPSYVSYQITGWVPTTAITRQVTRYFYHFPYNGQTADMWWVDTDNHRFRLFWAPLAQLPPIIESQRWWLNILLQSQTT
jgi:hypothetical protein